MIDGGAIILTDLSLVVWLSAVSLLPSAIITWLAIYPIRRYAERLGLLDRPGGRKTHAHPVPLGGGIGIWLGVVGTFLSGTIAVFVLRSSSDLQSKLSPQITQHLEGVWSRAGSLWMLLGAGTVLVVLGLWDDRRGLSPWLRLGVQFFVATFVVVGLGYGLTAFIALPWLTTLLSIVWIVAVINSFNMLDNMDGLSGGVATIVAIALAAVMFSTPEDAKGPQWFVAALLMVVAGGVLGFLWHNRPPAKIFMGDGGSYFVGFLIAVATLLATYASYESVSPHAVAAPLCAMAVPLYDLTTVLWIRIREGRSPFEGDQSHFSHRLVAMGMTRPKAVYTIWLVTATCGLAAVLITRVTLESAFMVFGIVICMLLLIVILESTRWRKVDE
jgi:UDP-GlcNAc:undecaprenyl-phosphate GlcNAc-1-phosphate transferase